ncbi:cytochrome-c peroxidase [Sulfurimonas sp.]
MHISIFLIFLTYLLNAQAPAELRKLAISKGLQAIPSDYNKLLSMVDDSKNSMSFEKIYLGKKLFFDKNLSKDATISCSTCHNIKKGGEDDKPTAIGYKNQENPNHLNSPTVLNTAFSKHLFWDGRSSSLRDQAKGPTLASFEMASSPELIEERIKSSDEYKKLFKQAFSEDEPITFDNIAKAIATYEKTLVTRGDFDEFLEGDDNAMSVSAQKGLNLFINLGCKGCHFGPAVGGQKIQQFPLRDYNSFLHLTSTYHEDTNTREVTDISLNFKMYHPFPFENVGGFMGKDGNKKFRVPILRNISKTAPYFHNGVIKTLREAITLMGIHQVGVKLTPSQLDNMEAFLKSLDGEIVDYKIEE